MAGAIVRTRPLGARDQEDWPEVRAEPALALVREMLARCVDRPALAKGVRGLLAEGELAAAMPQHRHGPDGGVIDPRPAMDCQRRSKFPQFGRGDFPRVRGGEIKRRWAVQAAWAVGRGGEPAG